MLDDMEQMIKEKLLESLIDKMSDGMGERMKPKGLGVEVQAPDKEHLAEGLEKAKDLLGKGGDLGGDVAGKEMPEAHEGDESDEHRLMELLGDDEDDEKEM